MHCAWAAPARAEGRVEQRLPACTAPTEQSGTTVPSMQRAAAASPGLQAELCTGTGIPRSCGGPGGGHPVRGAERAARLRPMGCPLLCGRYPLSVPEQEAGPALCPGRSCVAVSSLQASDDPGAGAQRGSLSLSGAREPSGTGCNRSRNSLQLLLQDARLSQPGSPEKPHTSSPTARGQGVVNVCGPAFRVAILAYVCKIVLKRQRAVRELPLTTCCVRSPYGREPCVVYKVEVKKRYLEAEGLGFSAAPESAPACPVCVPGSRGNIRPHSARMHPCPHPAHHPRAGERAPRSSSGIPREDPGLASVLVSPASVPGAQAGSPCSPSWRPPLPDIACWSRALHRGAFPEAGPCQPWTQPRGLGTRGSRAQRPGLAHGLPSLRNGPLLTEWGARLSQASASPAEPGCRAGGEPLVSVC
ncbi:unnamed protein product [Rangifer tarandus platyrhynchus]|uniref:Uncharacterized protein n=1 Tax=Rangifer tarandus platyrhynchus TaxID=3082113 RepID=A0AC59ZMB8_RANTA